MKTQDIDKMIGMPDIDKEWARFEKEVIDQKPRRTWSLSRVAAVATVAVSIGAAAVVLNLSKMSIFSTSSKTSTISTEKVEVPKSDTFLFDNVEMQQIAATLANYYGVEVVFESEDAKHVRLYLQIEKSKNIDDVAELLNNFKKVSVCVRDGKLIIK